MKKTKKAAPGFGHKCDWRTATLKLARCVIAVLRSNGKIGSGSGLVIKKVNGKNIVERWDKDFIEALAFIGIEVVDKTHKKPAGRRPKTSASHTRAAKTRSHAL